jgi:hypothetical protein
MSKIRISVNQHRFFKNRSIFSNLVEFSHKTIVAIESGLQMDCAYTDFSKAFEILDHGIMLKNFYGKSAFKLLALYCVFIHFVINLPYSCLSVYLYVSNTSSKFTFPNFSNHFKKLVFF